MLLLTTGIRRGEMFGLQWNDVDFHNKLIRIKKSVSYTPKSGIVVGLPKSNAGIRDIPITDGMIRLLNEYKQGEKVLDDAFVFHTESEPFKPHHPDYATSYLRKFIKNTNLPSIFYKE
jgi:integrase